MTAAPVVLVILADSDFAEQHAECAKLAPGIVAFKNLASFRQTRHVFAEKCFDQAIVYTGSTDALPQATLNSIVKLLKPGNTLRVTFRGAADESFEKRLRLAGLSDLEKSSEGTYKLTRKVFKVELAAEPQAPAPAKQNAFSAALSNPQREKMDLEDLLKGDVVRAEEQGGSCATKPKACKNCSCGRKEEE